MKKFLIVLAIVAAAGCGYGSGSGAIDTESNQVAPEDSSCDLPPDPDPCLRIGISLAGVATWLLDSIADGDATEADLVHGVLADKRASYNECVLEYKRDYWEWQGVQ